jgi:hypothetical protein
MIDTETAVTANANNLGDVIKRIYQLSPERRALFIQLINLQLLLLEDAELEPVTKLTTLTTDLCMAKIENLARFSRFVEERC